MKRQQDNLFVYLFICLKGSLLVATRAATNLPGAPPQDNNTQDYIRQTADSSPLVGLCLTHNPNPLTHPVAYITPSLKQHQLQ